MQMDGRSQSRRQRASRTATRPPQVIPLLSDGREIVRAFHLNQQDALARQALVAVRGFARLIPMTAGVERLRLGLGARRPVLRLPTNDDAVVPGRVRVN